MIKFIIKNLIFESYFVENEHENSTIDDAIKFNHEFEAWAYIKENNLEFHTVIRIFIKK